MSESRSELIAWVNDLLRLNYTKVEQLGTDNLEFLQWLKKFWDRNFPGDVYDAVARRGAANEPAAANRSTNTPVRRAMHNNGGANRSMSGRLTAGNTSLRGPSPDHTVILNLQKELQEERTTVAALEKERDFYFGKLRDVELLIQQELERSPDSAESPLLKEIQAVLYSTEEGFEIPAEGAADNVDEYPDETF
ncbi:hypothetical protein BGZ52_009906 [Haplosporangium bisporale]|nr:hypothetical protein BGZ52_009906 [Haplosporangium bisporale]